jgi:hypothetical protein
LELARNWPNVGGSGAGYRAVTQCSSLPLLLMMAKRTCTPRNLLTQPRRQSGLMWHTRLVLALMLIDRPAIAAAWVGQCGAQRLRRCSYVFSQCILQEYSEVYVCHDHYCVGTVASSPFFKYFFSRIPRLPDSQSPLAGSQTRATLPASHAASQGSATALESTHKPS